MSTKKSPLYSSSRRATAPASAAPASSSAAGSASSATRPYAASASASTPGTSTRPAATADLNTLGGKTASAVRRHPADPRGWPWSTWLILALLVTVAGLLASRAGGAGVRPVTQDDIDRAVRASLEKEPLPSAAAAAYEAILPSVVRVIGLDDESETEAAQADEKAEEKAMERSLGTGVVIVDNGTILTNLHVVWGAKKIRVRFMNGHESEAVMVGAQPENDLAVLRAQSLPDDLEAATMRSTADLRPGDHVIAVGHPFGIGPSVSHGVVSGLKREFRSPEGEKMLTNLIQFDAAANPGNSGGPLVTMEGEVVGVVTAILNPTKQRVFVGIGFAVPIENAAAGAGMPPF